MRSYEYDQHFLKSPRRVAELVGHTNIRKNDTVYDFGAGSGIISAVLSRRCKQVVAIENEPQTYNKLLGNMAASSNVQCVQTDILSVVLPHYSYKVFSNPPFSLSSELVNKLVFSKSPPKTICMIVQKQFANKLVPSDKHFTSALGIQIAPLYTARIRLPLRPSDFTPPPAVATVLLELKLRDTPLMDGNDLESYRAYVASRFSDYELFRKDVEKASVVSPERKPSELHVDGWIQLFIANR